MSINHSKLTKKELVERSQKLEEIMSSPVYNMYLSQRVQVDSISMQFKDVFIDITNEESTLFRNWLAWSDKTPKIREGVMGMKRDLDPDEAKKAEAERVKAARTSAEAWAKRREDKMNQQKNDQRGERMP